MTSDHETGQQKETLYCAHCGTENGAGAYACDRCGEKLYIPDPMRPPPMGLAECSNCTTANEARASYCVKCGNSLADAARISVLSASDSSKQAVQARPSSIRISPQAKQTPEEPRSAASAPAPSRSDEDRQAERREQSGEENHRRREEARERTARAVQAEQASSQMENNSGTRTATLPRSARGWNTAAFLLGPIWGPLNGVWLGLLGLVFFLIPSSVEPFGSRGVQFFLYLTFGAYLGYRGNLLAWRAKRWQSLEHFMRVQQQWMLVALVINVLLLMVILVVAVS